VTVLQLDFAAWERLTGQVQRGVHLPSPPVHPL
jgi:hypothetical protein